MENHQAMRENGYATRVEIAFEAFPCGPCASEAHKALTFLEGVVQIVFNPCVRRASVFFDPSMADIPLILSTLEPFCPNTRVISVMIPIKKERSNDKNFDVRRLD